MKKEKIFNRGGQRIKLVVWLRLDYDKSVWSVDVSICNKGCSRFSQVLDRDNWKFKQDSRADRKSQYRNECYKYVTTEEILILQDLLLEEIRSQIEL